jgi:hypothetical protein
MSAYNYFYIYIKHLDTIPRGRRDGGGANLPVGGRASSRAEQSGSAVSKWETPATPSKQGLKLIIAGPRLSA